MKYVNLGSAGLRVSRVCLGMMSYGNDSDRPWVLDEQIVKAAADGGITFYDTADTYFGGASEVATGRLLGKLFDRDDVVVAAKVYSPVVPTGRPDPGPGRDENGHGLSRKHVMAAIDASLWRLGMDYVDLFQIHRWDYQTPIEDTAFQAACSIRSGVADYALAA